MIWIVQQRGCITPLAAFTVKHEMQTWLSTPPRHRLDVVIWRVGDGGREVKQMRIEEL